MIWISSHISAGYRDRKWARDTFRRDFSDRVDPIEMAILEEIDTTMDTTMPEVMKKVVEVMKFWWSCGRRRRMNGSRKRTAVWISVRFKQDTRSSRFVDGPLMTASTDDNFHNGGCSNTGLNTSRSANSINQNRCISNNHLPKFSQTTAHAFRQSGSLSLCLHPWSGLSLFHLQLLVLLVL